MKKGYLIVEILGVMALMVAVSLVLDSMFKTLMADIPRMHRMVEETWYGGGADAQPLFDAGVATLYFTLSDGYHFIHGSGDTPGTLDRQLLADTARLVYGTAAAVAEGEYQPEERQPPPDS